MAFESTLADDTRISLTSSDLVLRFLRRRFTLRPKVASYAVLLN